MTIALSDVPRWFSLDADHDISTFILQLSLDQIGWDNATYGTPPSDVVAEKALERPIEAGMIRYWWFIQTGPTQTLKPVYGTNIFHGLLSENGNDHYERWRVYVPLD